MGKRVNDVVGDASSIVAGAAFPADVTIVAERKRKGTNRRGESAVTIQSSHRRRVSWAVACWLVVSIGAPASGAAYAWFGAPRSTSTRSNVDAFVVGGAGRDRCRRRRRGGGGNERPATAFASRSPPTGARGVGVKRFGLDLDDDYSFRVRDKPVRRRPIVAGNWKLNPKTLGEATNLLKLLSVHFLHHERDDDDVEVVVFPPFPYLSAAVELLAGTGVKVGAQNVGTETEGAFTGEVSASMVRSVGCDYALLGHSERRSLYDETDESINQRVRLALAEPGLGVVLCVGETLEEYENDLLEGVVGVQVRKGLIGVSAEDLVDRVVVAYEPVWAIGTGLVATPEQAQRAHEVVRRSLAEAYGPEAASAVRVQYGGSVKPESIEALGAERDVDGALVGGASLTAESFLRIVDGAAAAASSSSSGRSSPRRFSAREVVPCRNVLGESPVWSARDRTLYWISAPEEEVWAWNLVDPPYRRLCGTTLGCVALVASPNGGREIVLGGERALLTTTMTPDDDSVRDLGPRPERDRATRPNDGRVDRQGRLVLGMYNNYHRVGASAGENNAGLYRIGPDLRAKRILDYDYRVSNCVCFSPGEGDVLYFCDTPTRRVYAFDYDVSDDDDDNAPLPLSNRRLVYTVPAHLPGGPDGAQVDAAGFLWIALSGAGRVIRVDPATGDVDTIVHLPVKCPTSVTFGGEDLDELFVTTRGPDGGGLYSFKLPRGIVGLPEPEFVVNRDVAVAATDDA